MHCRKRSWKCRMSTNLYSLFFYRFCFFSPFFLLCPPPTQASYYSPAQFILRRPDLRSHTSSQFPTDFGGPSWQWRPLAMATCRTFPPSSSSLLKPSCLIMFKSRCHIPFMHAFICIPLHLEVLNLNHRCLWKPK